MMQNCFIYETNTVMKLCMTDDVGSYRKVYFVMPKGQHTAVTDHLGNHYDTEKAMAEAYNISYSALLYRLHDANWSLKKALTTPPLRKSYKKVKDHNGKTFASIKEMCEYHNICVAHFHRLRKKGHSIRSALTRKTPESVLDHKSNSYTTLSKMCQHYNIPLYVFSARIKKGWDTKKALTAPLQPRSRKTFIYKNKTYHSVRALVEDHPECDVSEDMVSSRLKAGWDIDKAMNTPRAPQKRLNIEYQGQTYSNYIDIIRAYNVPVECVTNGIKRRIHENLPPQALLLPLDQAWKLAFVVHGTPYFYTQDGDSYDIQTVQQILNTNAQPLHYSKLNYIIHHLDEPVPLDITHT